MRILDGKQDVRRLPGSLRKVDLSLIELFLRVHRLRNLTAAGEELGLSQPAVSRGLARLREAYDDALFVRQQHGVQPTALADRLAIPMASVLEVLRGTLERTGFDPSTATRSFKIAMNDIGERWLLPRLMAHLWTVAPAVEVQTCRASLPELCEGLTSGQIDLVVGFLPELGKQFHQQRLMREHFVYIARKGHPVVQGSIDPKMLCTLPHVLAEPRGMPHGATVMQALKRRRGGFRIGLRVNSFLSVGPVVAHTDFVSVVPNNLATLVADHLPLQIIAPPMRIPGFEIAMAWHSRFHREPASEWLRGVVEELFLVR